jgi:hypothetical protein
VETFFESLCRRPSLPAFATPVAMTEHPANRVDELLPWAIAEALPQLRMVARALQPAQAVFKPATYTS